jgi:hypothetical protein
MSSACRHGTFRRRKVTVPLTSLLATMFLPLNSARLRSTVSTSAPCTSIEIRRPSLGCIESPEPEPEVTGSGAGGGSGAACSTASTIVFPTALTP